MRIATWNLERTTPSQPQWSAIEDQIRSVNADIWILTETNSQLSLGEGYAGYHSHPIDDYHIEGECRTSIWTKLTVIGRAGTHDPETAVCVELESPFGVLWVYGTVIEAIENDFL